MSGETLREEEPKNVCYEGGPWNGWWLDTDRHFINRRAAANMRYAPGSPAGTILGYEPTKRSAVGVKGRARVWRWTLA